MTKDDLIRMVNEADIAQLIEERDVREDILDKVLDMVLGTDRPEWSSHYQYIDAVEDVCEALAQPYPEYDRGFSNGWDKCAERQATQPVQPEPWKPKYMAYRPGGLAQELFGNSEQLERQEPVAWMCQEYRAAFMGDLQWFDEVEFVQPPNDPERFRNITPLFTAPPQRRPLTDAEIWQMVKDRLYEEIDELRAYIEDMKRHTDPGCWERGCCAVDDFKEKNT